MTKFIGFLVFVAWTVLSIVLGYVYKSNRVETVHVAETTVTCPESKTVFLVPYPDPIEEYLDWCENYYGNDDGDYEDECGEDLDLNQYKPRIVVKDSKQKNNRQLMLGIQNSGNVEARYNHPVSNNFGVYVGGDTGMKFSVGVSFSF